MERSTFFAIPFALVLIAACSNEPAPADEPQPDEPAAVKADTAPAPTIAVSADTIVASSTAAPMPPPVSTPTVPTARSAPAKTTPSKVVFTEVEVVEEPPPTTDHLTNYMMESVEQEGEDVGVPPPVELENEILSFAQEMPLYPGGEVAMYAYLKEHLRYPEMEKEAAIQGKVYMQFVVNKDGSLSDLRVMRGISPGLDKEALRLVKSMPKWEPGKQNGKPVRVQTIVPVKFVLQ